MLDVTRSKSRRLATLLAFCGFLALAGASSQTPEEEKASIEKDYGLSDSDFSLGVTRFGSPSKLRDAHEFAKQRSETIDTVFRGIQDYGSLDDYKNGISQELTPQKYRAYKARISLCRSDWAQCADNEQLVRNYSRWVNVQTDCQMAAEGQARYGNPVWPWGSFGSFYEGKLYVTSGIAVAVEPDAQFQNGFGAMAHSRVTCAYDLRAQRVITVNISPR